MICIVVFCTTYALILPAITEEKQAFCGYTEHIHDEKCLQAAPDAPPELICGAEESQPHVHTEDCFLPAHIHGEECWQMGEAMLLCELPEQEGHAHADGCYTVENPIVCALAESEGHTHGSGCFTEPDAVLSCGQEESEEHLHDDTCYTLTQAELICPLEESAGHSHGEACRGESVYTMVCTLEETEGHLHGDACYTAGEPVLICALEERAEVELICTAEETEIHVHTDACYAPAAPAEEILVCQLSEHAHTLGCFSNPNADVETAEVWERTFADREMTGVWREDLLTIAQSQMGYMESTRNYIVLDDGTTIKGYTRYGHWYGDHYGDWCAMFASFCLHYAGVEQMPLESGCQRWIEALSEEEVGLYRSVQDYLPRSGDLIFFNHDAYEDSDHVGLVYELYTDDDETMRIRTIEGNTGNTVRFETYAMDDETIMGYGVLPEQIVEETAEEAETIELVEMTLTASIYTDGGYQTLSDDAAVITVTGLLPAEAAIKAYPVTIDNGMNILCAYDIAIVLPDGTVYEPADGASLAVSIHGGEVDSAGDIQAYYIPEEGDPEPVDTVVTDDGVSFEAPHFSVYALTVSGTMNTVYLNGASGNDAAAGTQNAPVRTFERACELLAPGGTIYISGTVTVTEAKEWSLGNASIRRASSFTGPLITVSGGASLDLSDITIHGNSGTPSASDIATNTSYASNSVKAPLIVVNSGGSLAIHDGTLLTNNSNKPDTASNIFKENGYVGQGGAIYCNGSLTMDGGTIQYCEAQSGGGIYIENGTFDLSGGLIDHNYARDIVSTSYRTRGYYKNAGGGVYVGDNSTMNMSGGTISNNQSSREGGGISLGWLNRTNGAAISEFITTFNMTGGTIDGNTATSTGGGLNITAGRQAFISAGTFTNNRANGQEYQPDSGYSSPSTVYSGGAIYLDARQKNSSGQYAGKPGYAVINRALIADNSATYYGGGIACCSTANSSVNASIDLSNGTAIYNNTAQYGNEMHLSGVVGLVSDKVLGGGSYNWSKSGSAYDNSLTESSTAIVNAKKLATVIITDNYGYYGGGIGCNGTIEIGGETDTTSISITKTWEDVDGMELPAYIEVQIYRDGVPYGDPVRIYRAADGTWPTYYLDGLETGYTYTVKEITIPGFTGTVTQNGNSFTIVNTATGLRVEKRWVGDTAQDRPASIQMQLYQNDAPYLDPVTLNADNGWSYFWIGLPERDDNGNTYTYTVREVTVPEGYYSDGIGQVNENGVIEITNTKSPETSVSVEKRWIGTDAPGAESITVQLLANGEAYGAAVTLNAANNWFYQWTGLPELDTSGNPITYSVRETAVPGYSTVITQGSASDAVKTWVPVSGSLTNGQQYLLVSSSGALAGDSGSGLQWLDVSAQLTDGSLPAGAALWTYNGGKFQNGDSKYLALINSGSFLSPKYNFGTNSSGSSITFSTTGLLSCKGGLLSTTYYLSSSLTAVTGSGSAAQLTAWVRTDSSEKWGDVHYVITNTKEPDRVNINFGKYVSGSAENSLPLAGAELALYRQDADSQTLIPGTDVTGTLISDWTSEDIFGSSGGIHTLSLFDGTYYLVETRAPDGYIGLTAPIVFEVDASNHAVTVIEYPGYEVTIPSGETIEFPIYNAASYKLPETGGMGTAAFTFSGLVLMAAALMWGYMLRRKRERGAE